jgi:hypothetical protein
MDNKVLKGRGRSTSMSDLNRDLEVDERRIETEPLDEKKKKIYENRPNPFPKNEDPEYPNNCIAVPGKGPKVDVIETSRKAMVI